MKQFKLLIIFFICLLLTIPSLAININDDDDNPQENTALSFGYSFETADDQTTEYNSSNNDSDDVKSDKKKKKDKNKDLVKLDNHFFLNLGIDIATVLLIIFLIYYPATKRRENIFSLIMFNIVIFFLTYILNDVKISMGAAFGLFAVFSMLRYRTAGISMKDMTYLFVFIAVGLLSAINAKYYDLLIINGVLFLIIFILDGGILFKREYMRTITYDKIENINEDKYDDLLNDLKKRTSLEIHRVSIGKIDYLKDSAIVKVFFYKKRKKDEAKEA